MTNSTSRLPQVLLSSASDPDDSVAATASAALQRASMLNPSTFAAWLPFILQAKGSASFTPHCVSLLIVCVMKCSGSSTALQQLSM
jgi:hypothetical protein